MYSVSAPIIAWFALAWFLVGLAVGRILPAAATIAKRTRSRAPRSQSGSSTPTELYVGNLAYSVSKRELAKCFGKYGDVVDVRLIRNRASGKSRGYGFVVMADNSAAGKAVKALNGSEIKGRAIVVNEAKSRSRDDD
jgi:RNA recognition motif-containing protein